MDERLRFVARLLDGENMAAMCREFGISRKTGYKILQSLQGFRYSGSGRSGPKPLSAPQQNAFQVEKAILRIKQDHKTWGHPRFVTN